MTNNTVYGINGPVVKVLGATNLSMLEMVYVGENRLIGEVIAVDSKFTTIQVYDETSGLRPGEPVFGTGTPMSVKLSPSLISDIFDGIGRPLRELEARYGAFIGVGNPETDTSREYSVTIKVSVGENVAQGDIFAEIPETPLIQYRCMIPPGVNGTVEFAASDGNYKQDDTLITVRCDNGKQINLGMCCNWPIRTPRPYIKRMSPTIPLITGQRVIDTLFPVSKGGTAAIPGGFGTGKTMTQHQLAKWCDADIIVYVGCGERGNEMCQVLDEFSKLIDTKNNRPLLERTVMIANTSNMPVAAREASVYTGVTIAEYYRDMGYHVAMMADSTSRWAEALREISGRLEEMPAEEGFPAYLPSRLSEFYERAAYVQTLGNREGSVTLIGAVSPQGADFSEPVTQNTKRFTRCFWALDKSLAYQRHYPAINWMQSYSEYYGDLDKWYDEHVDHDFLVCRDRIIALLHEEDSLNEIVKLIGSDVLPDDQKLIIEIGRVIRTGFLQQNAFHKDDTYVPLKKQEQMMDLILYLYYKGQSIISTGVPFSDVVRTGMFDKLCKMKYDIPNDKPEMFAQYKHAIDDAMSSLGVGGNI